MPTKQKKVSALTSQIKRIGLLRFSVLGAAFLVIFAAFVFTESSRGGIYAAILAKQAPGSIAERDIILPQDLVFLDSAATEKERRAREMQMLPVFVLRAASLDDTKKRIAAFRDYLAKRKVESGPDETYLLQPGELDFISRSLRGDILEERLNRCAEEILGAGYYMIPWNIFDTYKSIVELFSDTGTGQSLGIVDLATVVTRKNLREIILSRAYADKLDSAAAQALFIAAYALLDENALFDEAATFARLQKIRESVRPVFKTVPAGTLLVAKGGVINEDVREKIRLLAYSAERKSARAIGGLVIYIALLLVIAAILLRPPLLEKSLSDKEFLFLVIINTLYLLTAIMIYRFISLPDNFPVSVLLPTALVTMLISVLLSYRAGVLNTAILSLCQILFTAVSPEAIAFVFFSGIIGTRVVRKAERRMDLLNAGMLLSLEQGGAAVILSILAGYARYLFFAAVLSAALSGLIWGILNMTILPLIENILRAATKFRLMELSDLNNPTMKRMLSQAPGTYNHSISVGNLAETACREIGANALLARVGAYYHDIGKIDQAEYFIENQSGYNKHDYLKAGLSSAIIRSHVKIGMEQAAKLRLPDEVRDIIAQHHGAGVIRFFYMKALEGKEPCINPEDYSYTGRPPQSREAAVVMLADSVEAASRLFKKPNFVTIEKAVAAIVREKVNSGQLAEAPISLRDLDQTRESFVKVLSGYFHSRIEYPEESGARK